MRRASRGRFERQEAVVEMMGKGGSGWRIVDVGFDSGGGGV